MICYDVLLVALACVAVEFSLPILRGWGVSASWRASFYAESTWISMKISLQKDVATLGCWTSARLPFT